MPVTNVKSKWVNGNLVFYDAAGDVVFTVDGENRKVIFPSGSALETPEGSFVVIEPDDVTIEVDGGSGEIQVKAGGIDTAQLTANAVDATILAADAVETDKINNGAVTLEKVAAATLDGTVAKVVANANLIGGLPVLHRILTVSGASGDIDVLLTHKTRVVDSWIVLKGAGVTGGAITIKNETTAITNAMAVTGNDKAIVRAGEIDDAQQEIAAGDNLRVSTASTGGDIPACEVYVLGIRVA